MFRLFYKSRRYRWTSRWSQGNWCRTRTASSIICSNCRPSRGLLLARNRSTLLWCHSSVSENNNLIQCRCGKMRYGRSNDGSSLACARSLARSIHPPFNLRPRRSFFQPKAVDYHRRRRNGYAAVTRFGTIFIPPLFSSAWKDRTRNNAQTNVEIIPLRHGRSWTKPKVKEAAFQ